MYWLYNIVAEKRIDKDAVVRVLRRFYGKWMHLSNQVNSSSYNIVLDECSKPEILDVNIVKTCIQRGNAYSILKAIEYGRALLRHNISWMKKTYVLTSSGEKLEDLEIHPAFDVLIWSNETWILDKLGLKYGLNPLIHKRFGGEYIVYSGKYQVARLHVPDKGIHLHGEQLNVDDIMDNDLLAFIDLNKPVLLKHVAITRRFLESLGEPDIVVVSFSGGKDSLVVLDLAVKHYGRENVVGIYVDTGVDFEITRRYVKQVSEYYGVEIYSVYAPVKEYISRRGLPSRSNRWCTILKTRAFKKKLAEITTNYKKTLVLVGDRDVESEARARKPPVRRRDKYLEAAPLKQWPTLYVQLYIWINNLELNLLYKLGFSRLGCYICPALTSLEKYVMIEKLHDQLIGKPWFREFMKREVESNDEGS